MKLEMTGQAAGVKEISSKLELSDPD
jgi:hypothetical protein